MQKKMTARERRKRRQSNRRHMILALVMVLTLGGLISFRVMEMEKQNVSFEELEHLTLGALRKAVVDGDVKMGTVMAGQIAGLIKKEQTCEEIITEIMDKAEELLKLNA